MVRLGIDLGGTKIEIIALAEDGATLYRSRVPTPSRSYSGVVCAIGDLVRHIEGELGRTGTLGVGSPGAIDPATDLIRNSNSVVLNGKPLLRDIESEVGRHVRIANDANCLALSESVDGSGKDARVVFAAILGTGVGGGISVNRTVLQGKNLIAGEWGHNPLPGAECEDDVVRCYCGRYGCIETFLSGPNLARYYTIATGRSATASEIATAAERGDPIASRTLSIYEDRLARALAQVANILDPDVFVLGGGVSNIDRLFDNVPELVRRYTINASVSVTLTRAIHGDSSGVRGAAWLWNPAAGDFVRCS
jgi:fructokinase